MNVFSSIGKLGGNAIGAPESPPPLPAVSSHTVLRRFRWLALALAAGTLGWLCWLGVCDPRINFLADGPAQWIGYPLSLNGKRMPGIEWPATFRRTFFVKEFSSPVRLSWRAFRKCKILLDGQVVAAAGAAGENWKKTSRLEISKYVHPGANQIEVRVLSTTGPPALSLKVEAPGLSLRTDARWEASLAGSVWRPARPAAAPLAAGPGNDLDGSETLDAALAQSWRTLAFFALVSIAAVGALSYLARRTKPRMQRFVDTAVIFAIAAAWVALLVHNFALLSSILGFDASDHQSYISYLLDTKALPSADEGWEMYQPPFYYAAGAALLSLCGLATSQAGGIFALRLLNLALGAAQVALVSAALRPLFPGQWKKQAAGAILAAFVPAQLYLLHYTTNETLCAAMASAGIFLGLRILRPPQAGQWLHPGLGATLGEARLEPSAAAKAMADRRPTGTGVWLHAGLGATLGLALLSKVSALPAVAVIFAVLAARLIDQRTAWRGWLQTIGLSLALTLVIGGWHYARLWAAFGNPLIGNWDAKLGETWWQQPGLHTWTYYLTFGQALTKPFFSGFHSFWDSVYSTLWGDGLLGGRAELWSRPPWNYNLMAAGYALALGPSLMVVTGLLCVLIRCWRAPRLEWLLLAGVTAAYGLAIIFMSLKLPYYDQAKAFYGLPALLPFCIFFVVGLEFWTVRGQLIRNVVLAALGLWLINTYASFWVSADAPATNLSAAAGMYLTEHGDPTGDLLKVLQEEPHNGMAATLLALVETRNGHPQRAVKSIEEAVRTTPGDPRLCAEAAICLAGQKRSAEAMACAQRAIGLGPDCNLAAAVCCRLAFEAKRYNEAVTAGRLAVGLMPADAESHFLTGVALMNLHRDEEAMMHFSVVLAEQPARAEAHYYLGAELSSQPGQRAGALAHLTQAVRLSPTNQAWRAALEKLQKQGQRP